MQDEKYGGRDTRDQEDGKVRKLLPFLSRFYFCHDVFYFWRGCVLFPEEKDGGRSKRESVSVSIFDI